MADSRIGLARARDVELTRGGTRLTPGPAPGTQANGPPGPKATAWNRSPIRW